jgi:RND family efflux transporter MFP subunit
MSNRRPRKSLLLLFGFLGVVAVAGLGLWVTGNLPLGSDSARAGGSDSTQVAGVADSVTAESGSERDEDEPEQVPVPVELAKVERRSIAAFYRAASVVEADRLVDLVAKVTGRVHVLAVEEGDWVKEGQVLAELENDRERIQLRQAELKLTDQQRDLERNEAMLAEELISRQVYDDVKAAFDLAETDRDLARIALEETIIRAPFAGQVTDRKIVRGQQVNLGVALFTLADFQPLRVRVHLPETIALKVSEGQRVLVYPEAQSEACEAVVERIAPVVDPATSTVRLTLQLQGDPEQVRVGGFVKVRITTATRRETLAIPKIALVEEGGLRSVFVAAADTVRKVEVRTGLFDETHIEILDGVAEGDFIITLGQGNLRTGSLVDPLNAAAVGWSAGKMDGSLVTDDPETTVALQPEP